MATFTVSASSSSPTSVTFTARFTGGDSSYSYHRYIKIQLSGPSYGRQIKDIESTESSGATSSFNYTVTGLNQNTTYTYTITLGYMTPNGIVYSTDQEYIKTGTVTTQGSSDPDFYCDVDEITENSVSFLCQSFHGDSDYNDYRYVRLIIPEANIDTYFQSINYGGPGSNFDISISGLTPNTDYSYTATLYVINQQGNRVATIYDDSGSFKTLSPPPGSGYSVYIGNGSSWEKYKVYIGNDSNWEPYTPHIGNESNTWD